MDEKKVREAIEALKIINLKRVHPFYDWEEMREVRNIAIEALEKQLTKKPVLKQNAYGGKMVCPICGVSDSGKYFRQCGQKLDWLE